MRWALASKLHLSLAALDLLRLSSHLIRCRPGAQTRHARKPSHQCAVQMADEADRLSPSATYSVGRAGDTRYAAPSSSAGSTYELHVLPEKARNIATSETSTDDDLGVFSSSPLHSQQKEEMSRVPLLVRSSPAQGTGKLMGASRPCVLGHLFASWHHNTVALVRLVTTSM